MPRYFFHLRDGSDLPDEVGTELTDLASAQERATRLGAEMLMSQAESFWNDGEWNLRVSDETGLVLFNLCFLAFESAEMQRHQSGPHPGPLPAIGIGHVSGPDASSFGRVVGTS